MMIWQVTLVVLWNNKEKKIWIVFWFLYCSLISTSSGLNGENKSSGHHNKRTAFSMPHIFTTQPGFCQEQKYYLTKNKYFFSYNCINKCVNTFSLTHNTVFF